MRAVPSLHCDSFLATVPGSCPVRRQATPTNFIAGRSLTGYVLSLLIISQFLRFYPVIRQTPVSNNCKKIVQLIKKPHPQALSGSARHYHKDPAPTHLSTLQAQSCLFKEPACPSPIHILPEVTVVIALCSTLYAP